MRSFIGCLTCRNRKVKCDETRPVCGQCRKSSRPCKFSTTANFRHYGSPRKQRNVHALTDGSPSGKAVNRRSRENSTTTSTAVLHVSLDNEEDNAAFEEIATVDDEPTLSDVSIDGNEPLSVQNGHLPTPSSPSAMQTQLDTITLDNDIASTPSRSVIKCSRTLWQSLLMHFKQGPGTWMDMFDYNAYFTTTIPHLASGHSLLKAAICALAARHIHRMSTFEQSRTDLQLRKWYLHYKERGEHIDWKYKYCDFYDQAIVHLKSVLQFELASGATEVGRQSSAELLASIAILSMYELMDGPSEQWRAHLSALPLLDVASQNILQQSMSPTAYPAQPKKSIFWNFVRQDSLSAFLQETQTHLDFTATSLWRHFGLPIDDQGLFSGLSPNLEDDDRRAFGEDQVNSSAEETFSNAMTWIRGKIINFITAGDSIDPEDFGRPPGMRTQIGVNQEVLLERWRGLKTQLDMWEAALPETFTSYTRSQILNLTTLQPDQNTPESAFEKIFYSLPMCAATMQTYHMARILLLVNRPQESTAVRSTVTARLDHYRQVRLQALWHAREICGISLARPLDAVRTHSLQPLFVAGQCFESPADRQTVLNLLQAVEDEVGWASFSCRQKLKDEWDKSLDL